MTLQPRHTGRGIVIRDDQLLLMERWRDGLHYFSIPGGGIEPGETPDQTAIREIFEETTCQVSIDRQLYRLDVGSVQHHIFLCQYQSGEPTLLPSSEEAVRATDSNRFLPRWLPLADLQRSPFVYWQPVQRQLLEDLKNGFTESIIVLDGPAG